MLETIKYWIDPRNWTDLSVSFRSAPCIGDVLSDFNRIKDDLEDLISINSDRQIELLTEMNSIRMVSDAMAAETQKAHTVLTNVRALVGEVE